jgi:hypothetical protein
MKPPRARVYLSPQHGRVDGAQLPVTSYQLSVISYQLGDEDNGNRSE